jgi:hypothetical protein
MKPREGYTSGNRDLTLKYSSNKNTAFHGWRGAERTHLHMQHILATSPSLLTYCHYFLYFLLSIDFLFIFDHSSYLKY